MPRNEELEEAQRRILLLEAEVERLSMPPYLGATIVGLGNKTARISVDGSGFCEVSMNDEHKAKLKMGERIVVNNQARAILGYSEFNEVLGETCIVDEVINGRIRVKSKGESVIVHSLVEGVKSGDEVILDTSRSLALERLERKKTKYNLEQVSDAPWTSIGGLEETVAQIREEIEQPFLHKEVYARYGRTPIKGILLYGAPGCGKTLIARSIAYSLSRLNGQVNGQMISVKGPEILDKWVGSTEASVRQIYQAAAENSRETNGPTIVFIDEAEALLKVRGSGISSDVYDTIVPQFLADMDGIDGNGNVITVLATNREDIIDPAILRPGRVDRRIKVSRPSKEGAREIFGIYLKGKPLGGSLMNKLTPEKLTDQILESLYSDSNVIYDVVRGREVLGQFHARNLVSGALIKGIVDRASGYAIKDEIAGKRKGIYLLDLERAASEEIRELSGVPQSLVRSDWNDAFGDDGKTMYEMYRANALSLISRTGKDYSHLEISDSTKLHAGGKT